MFMVLIVPCKFLEAYRNHAIRVCGAMLDYSEDGITNQVRADVCPKQRNRYIVSCQCWRMEQV